VANVQDRLAKISPIAQALILDQMKIIGDQLNRGDVYGAWRCVGTLMDLYVPPKVYEKNIELFDEIQGEMNKIATHKELDTVRQHAVVGKRITVLLRGRLRELLRGIKDSLYRGGYMEYRRYFEESTIESTE
jgi:hypothetical protein